MSLPSRPPFSALLPAIAAFIAAAALTGCEAADVSVATDTPATHTADGTGSMDPVAPTDGEGGFEQYWEDVRNTAWKYANQVDDQEALAALERMEELDRWTTPDLNEETIRVNGGAPEWVFELVEKINAGTGRYAVSSPDDATAEVMSTFGPALTYLSAIDNGAEGEEEIAETVERSYGWVSCAATWCPSGTYTSLSTAKSTLTSSGYHLVPSWAGGNEFDYAKATSYCRRYERVICQSYCTSAGCTNPSSGQYKTYEEGPEPDPELYTCAYAWVFGTYGFTSWALYVWTYHALC